MVSKAVLQSIEANVIYWPSTELSIKRCTCVNKRKNSGNRWALNNNITRCTDGSSKLETTCWSESQQQTEGFGPSLTYSWATPVKMRKKCCYGREKNLGPNNSLSSSPTHLSYATNITLWKIKCERLYFYKEAYSFVIEVVHYRLMMFPHVSVYLYIYTYTCICMWLYNTNSVSNALRVSSKFNISQSSIVCQLHNLGKSIYLLNCVPH